jgi:hypothetical protein
LRCGEEKYNLTEQERELIDKNKEAGDVDVEFFRITNDTVHKIDLTNDAPKYEFRRRDNVLIIKDIR